MLASVSLVPAPGPGARAAGGEGAMFASMELCAAEGTAEETAAKETWLSAPESGLLSDDVGTALEVSAAGGATGGGGGGGGA